MGGLFSTPKAKQPEDPDPVRMPTPTDPALEAASARAKADALRRRGRRSTILTDNLQSMTGSSGQSLGN